MTSDGKLKIRKTPALGPTEISEIVYSGSRLPSDEELARLNAIPAPVYVLNETVDLVGADDETTELPVVELPERYEDRYPAMALDPLMQRIDVEARRRVLAQSTMLEDYEESERIGARILAAMKGLRELGRLTIDKLPLLFAGDQVYIRREIVGPIREWIVAFLVRVATFTRKDKRPTVFNHVATVIRALRAVDVALMTEEILAVSGVYLFEQLDKYYRLRAAGDPDARFAIDGKRISLPDNRGPVVDYLICEALGKGGVQLRPLLDSYGIVEDYSIAIARHRLATQEHRAKIVDAELSLLGRAYGYAKIGAHAADYGLTWLWNLAGGPGDVYAFRWLCRMERYPMCSWKSLYSYRKGGLPFSTALSTGSPDDLADECLRKTPTIWSWPFISPTIRDELLDSGSGDQEGRTK